MHFVQCIRKRPHLSNAFILHHPENEPYKFALTVQLRVWAQTAKLNGRQAFLRVHSVGDFTLTPDMHPDATPGRAIG